MPTINANLNPELQKLEQSSALVELFQFDATHFGGSLFYFCNQESNDGSPLVFDGQAYTPFPIKVDGWDSTQTGTSAKPKLTISNMDNPTLRAAIIAQGDLVGAEITRIRTLSKFLDNGSAPDPTAILGPDKAYIEQKLQQNKTMIQFQLGSVIDRMGMFLPRRQVLKDENYLGCSFPGVARTRVR